MLYAVIILCANILIILGNWMAQGDFAASALLQLTLSSAAATLAVILLDGIEAFAIRRLPEKWFSADRNMFHISDKERKLYQKLGIKKWKDRIPELGGFTDFHKDKLQSTDDRAYLGRFILEARYGVYIHFANSTLGFFIAFIPLCSAPSIWIPVYAVNFVLNLLPLMTLRYNLPVLERLYKRTERKSRSKQAHTSVPKNSPD